MSGINFMAARRHNDGAVFFRGWPPKETSPPPLSVHEQFFRFAELLENIEL